MMERACRVHRGSNDFGDLFRSAPRGGSPAGITQFEHGEFEAAGRKNGGTFRKSVAVRQRFYLLQKVKLF